MLKKFFYLGAAAFFSFIAASCSVEKNASLEFSVPESFVRSVTGENAGAWTLRIALTDGYTQTKDFAISKPTEGLSSGTFSFDGLPAGATVKIQAKIYNGQLCRYKNTSDYVLKLSPGENFAAVELEKVLSTASIQGLSADNFYIQCEVEGKPYYDYNHQGEDGNEVIPDLPYGGEETFLFSLGCSFGDFDFGSCTYQWYLNGELLSEFTEHTFKSDLTELENLEIFTESVESAEGTEATESAAKKTVNSFVCLIKSESETLGIEYKFYAVEKNQ
ncbi:hypothetical protein [uncultured Treponema sp.]|uniref:hypothetical protein n=1 Tax=uncultured Treponema sp. TaxID=162155 RepID=UPI0015BFBCDB|nr:hypothetical protein [uncultured Treponema sp.]